MLLEGCPVHIGPVERSFGRLINASRQRTSNQASASASGEAPGQTLGARPILISISIISPPVVSTRMNPLSTIHPTLFSACVVWEGSPAHKHPRGSSEREQQLHMCIRATIQGLGSIVLGASLWQYAQAWGALTGAANASLHPRDVLPYSLVKTAASSRLNSLAQFIPNARIRTVDHSADQGTLGCSHGLACASRACPLGRRKRL